MSSPRLSFVATLVLVACAGAAAAQPAAGTGRARDGGDSRSIADRVERRAEGPALRPNTLGVFAGALEKEAPSLALSPAATAALQDFVRDLKDYAAMDDAHLRERAGLAPRTVHASVDVQRDLAAHADYAANMAGASRDVLARWKKLRELLDERQRQRMDALYGAAMHGGADGAERK